MTAEPVIDKPIELESVELCADLAEDNYQVAASTNSGDISQKSASRVELVEQPDNGSQLANNVRIFDRRTESGSQIWNSPGSTVGQSNRVTTPSPSNVAVYKTSLCLPYEDPERANCRLKQLFNALYFGLGTACAITVFAQFQHPGAFQIFYYCFMWPLVALFSLMTGLALGFSLRKPKASDFPHSFSRTTRKKLRIVALTAPLPFLIGCCLINASNAELAKGSLLVDSEHYAGAMQHLQTAVLLNPFNKFALAKMAYSENCLFNWQNAVDDASRAIALDATEPTAWADKAWALNKMARYGEALPIAEKACELDSSNGEAFASAADAYAGLGRYADALVAATRHTQLHYNETDAFMQRAGILEKLGRFEEARLMRTKGGN